MRHGWTKILLLLLLALPTWTVVAQETTTEGPVYIVQSGDNLWDIAARFGVTLDELIAANNLSSDSVIYSGAQLVIPGLEGISGVLTTQEVPFGETLTSLSQRYAVTVDILLRLNHLTSPNEIYVGMTLVLPLSEEIPESGTRLSLAAGQSLLELAIIDHSDPYTLAASNGFSSPYTVLPGQVLHSSSTADASDPGPGALPPFVNSVEISDFIQGQTSVIQVTSSAELSLSGSLMGRTLHFFPSPEGGYVALQGVHAMAEPGTYPLTIQGSLPNGSSFGFTQGIRLYAGDFLYDVPLYVDAETLDPAITGPENELWTSLTAPATPIKYWDGSFIHPVDPYYFDCYTSRFGSRRSYNDSDYIYFHTGLDYCNGSGSSVYAAAPGIVIFADGLDVRGCTVLLDHGWGVYTAYMHLQDSDPRDRETNECFGYGILVNIGDQVEAGQLIGLTGATGRVEGAHLHWEMLVGGIQVNPLEWVAQTYP